MPEVERDLEERENNGGGSGGGGGGVGGDLVEPTALQSNIDVFYMGL